MSVACKPLPPLPWRDKPWGDAGGCASRLRESVSPERFRGLLGSGEGAAGRTCSVIDWNGIPM
jgi:hypothetical protein